jgi:iron-sulfur cluster insertion protein
MENDFALTPSAAQRILTLLAEDAGMTGLRVAVAGGGCSGFQYEMSLVSAADPDDLTFEQDGAKVFIDPVSLPLVKGGSLDFIDDLGGSYFQILNPNATASCGCGNSFSA